MSTITSDPLLAVAKGILYFILGAIGIAGAGVAIAIPALAIFNGKAIAQLTQAGAPGYTVWLIMALLAIVVGVLYLAWRFFVHMLRIVRSVEEGDPFVPANADRLTSMAWIMLAINVVSIPVAALGAYIAKLAHDASVNIDVGVGGGGIVLILTLFVLARVFRKGTEMRADLEGTV
ncbi:DUF2975 domain-containing protein [Tsuneonella mangrovi]|uniref:DUF2975 domain-containing protein n=1 Tax=Tsuneonella mangrovi TaxID=1982042 RepID=UPI000BA259B8|nr:DUF2975 domain-containing protein [Tsuneonella mangrovi]